MARGDAARAAAERRSAAASGGPANVELSIRLSNGHFETKVTVPLRAGKAERDSAIERWLRLAGEALALGVQEMEANLGPEERRSPSEAMG